MLLDIKKDSIKVVHDLESEDSTLYVETASGKLMSVYYDRADHVWAVDRLSEAIKSRGFIELGDSQDWVEL